MMSENIKIGCVGRIVSGDDIGCWVKIEDDSVNTGGFLIHLSNEPAFVQGSDDWVANSQELEGYFEESNWEIEWTEK